MKLIERLVGILFSILLTLLVLSWTVATLAAILKEPPRDIWVGPGQPSLLDRWKGNI